MASRLPIPGQDNGAWGSILNDFLSQSLTSEGAIKPTAVANKAPLASPSFTGTVTVPTPTNPTDATTAYVDGIVSSGAPDASSTVKGIVRLTGDLGGTATAPTVPGLAGKEPSITAGTTAQYYRGDKTFQTLDKAAVGLSNVDNTSDATKNSATATLTGKTISGASNTLTNIPQSAITDLAAGLLPLAGATGQVLAKSSSGDRDVAWVTPGAASFAPRGNRVSFMGDSTLTHGGYASRTWTQSWPDMTCLLSGQRMALGLNAAIAGYTTAGVLSTQLPQILADPNAPAACIIGIGTNDIATGTGGIASGITPAATQANILAIDTALIAAGIEPIWATIPPRSVSATPTVTNIHAKTQAHNAWLRRFCLTKKRRLLDIYALLADPITGEYPAGFSSDGIHPEYTAIAYIGEYVAAQLADSFPEWSPPLASSFDDVGATGNLLLNPLFTADSNSDGVPDNWTVASSSNATVTTVPGIGVLGKSMRLANIGGPAGTIRVVADAITTGFNVGDTIGFGGKIKVKGLTSASIVYTVKLTYTSASSNGTLTPISAYHSDVVVPGAFYVEDVVPAGTTGIVVEASLPVNSQGTMDLSQFTVRNLSATTTAGWWTS